MKERLYRYGAGKVPPVLAGRADLRRDWSTMLDAVSADGRDSGDDLLLSGPRGVGKTCLLSAFSDDAKAVGFEVLSLQAVDGSPTLIGSLIRQAEDAVVAGRKPWKKAQAALERFAGVQFGVAGVSAGVTLTPGKTAGVERDPESLAAALAKVAEEIRSASPQGTGGLLITVDELQVGDAQELALLAATLHRLTVDHKAAPVVFVAAGLSHTMQRLIEAGVTHPDRLLMDTPIPLKLPVPAAREAVTKPAVDRGVAWAPEAVDAVLEASNRYPAHVQFFADAVWKHAQGARVTGDDALAVLPAAAAELTRRTLEPRWNELTGRQAEFITALAICGGRAGAAQLSAVLGRPQNSWSQVRADLLTAGEIYAPRHGVLEIAVPALAPYAIASYPDVQADSGIKGLLSLDELGANNLGQLTSFAPPPAVAASDPLQLEGRRVADDDGRPVN
jgi:hypothetical protein